MAKIILTGGGTAGHCTPNIALIPYLLKRFDEIYYVGSFSGIERKMVEKENITYFPITTVKLERKITPSNLTIPFKLLKGINDAEKIIKQIKPDLVFSKGGFVSVPLVIAAHKNKIPVICHESDYSFGLANKISLKYCDKMITSFPETAEGVKKATYIGSPIRNNLINIKKDYSKFYFDGSKPVLLVFGGSLGSVAINKGIREGLDELLETFDIIHICGKKGLDKKLKNKKGYFQTEFLFNISDALSITSVCVARAGANSLFELLSLKIPCVVIPIPKGISRGDQEQNALYFQKLGLITVLPQSALTGVSINTAVNSVYENRLQIKENFKNSPINDKSSIIASLLFSYLK